MATMHKDATTRTKADFCTLDGYYPDLVQEAVTEARAAYVAALGELESIK